MISEIDEYDRLSKLRQSASNADDKRQHFESLKDLTHAELLAEEIKDGGARSHKRGNKK